MNCFIRQQVSAKIFKLTFHIFYYKKNHKMDYSLVCKKEIDYDISISFYLLSYFSFYDKQYNESYDLAII